MAFTNEYTLNVDIKKRMANVVPIFRQGDTAKLNFRVYDNGVLFDLTGYTRSEITFRLPSGETLINNCILNQGIISYTFIGAEMAEVGDVSVILSIFSGNTVASVQPFTIHIYDNMRHDTLSYISILQDLIQQVQYLELEVSPLIDEVTIIKDELEALELSISNAEAIRVANENSRISDENTRISNEQTRVSSEQQRLQAEGTRIINESNRVNSENLRVVAEQARVNAENLRIQGSQERFEHFDSIIDDFDFKGEYNANTQYRKFNNVLYQGSTFTALKSVIGIPPTDDGINWTLSARRGTDGQGAVGSVNGFLPDLNGNVDIPVAEVINNFESHDTTKALSANKGRELKVLVDNKIISSETQPTTQVSSDMWFEINDTAIDSIDIENAVISNTPPINQNLLWFDDAGQGNITIKKFINGQWLKLNPATTINQVEDLLPALMNKVNVSDFNTLTSVVSNLNVQLNNLSSSVSTNTGEINVVKSNLNQHIAQKGQNNGYASLNSTGKVPSSQLDIATSTDAKNGTNTSKIMTPKLVLEVAVPHRFEPTSNVNLNNLTNVGEYGVLNGTNINGQDYPMLNSSTVKVTKTERITGQTIETPTGAIYHRLKYIDNQNWSELIQISDGVTNFSDLKQSVSDGKALIASVVTDKGVHTDANANFATIANNINNIQTGLRERKGTVFSSANSFNMVRMDGASVSSPRVVVSGLDFTPKYIILMDSVSSLQYTYETMYNSYRQSSFSGAIITSYDKGNNSATGSININPNSTNTYINSTGFALPVTNPSVNISWTAIG